MSLTPRPPRRMERSRRVRRDVKLLAIDARMARYVLRYAPDPDIDAADPAPDAVLGRVEIELAHEAIRYARLLRAAIATLLMPMFLAAFTWAGFWLLPRRIWWMPYDRGQYGLPLSLYETLGYAFLALFLTYGTMLTVASWRATRRLSADYRRIRDAQGDLRTAFTDALLSGRFPRTAYVVGGSAAFVPVQSAETPAPVAADESGEPVGALGEPAAEPGPEPLTAIRWQPSGGLGLVAASLALTVLAGVVVAVARHSLLGVTERTVAIAAALIGAYVVQALIIGGAAVAERVGVFAAVGLRRVDGAWRWAGIALGASVLARLGGAFLNVLLQGLGARFPKASDPTSILPRTTLGVALTVLLVCVAAPLVEEAIFRGALFTALYDKWGTWPAVVLSAAVFAGVHLSWTSFGPIFVLGVLLALLFLRSRSLWVPILCHAAYNGAGILVLVAMRGVGAL